MRIVSHETEKHTWAEVHVPGGELPPIVMDPWSEGTAVFAEDSRLGKDRDRVTTDASFDIESAADAHEWTDEFARGFQSSKFQRLDRAEEILEQMPPRTHPVPQPLLDGEFAGRVRSRLRANDPWPSVLKDVKAVGVAASLGGRGVPNLLADAEKIVQEATALVTPARTSDPA